MESLNPFDGVEFDEISAVYSPEISLALEWLQLNQPGRGNPEVQEFNLCHYLLELEPIFREFDGHEPPDWRWRSYSVRLRANWTCERCTMFYGKQQRAEYEARIYGFTLRTRQTLS